MAEIAPAFDTSIVPICELSVEVATEMTSPSLAPTWNEIVPAEPSSSLMPLKSAVLPTRDLRLELSGLGGDRRLVGRGERAVAVLHGELTHALEHRVHLVQRAFRRLDQADPVLGVALRLRETTDLTTELLADGESGCVVGRTVDAVSRAEALHRLAGTIARGGELPMGVEGLDVRVDAKGQVVVSLMTWGWSIRSRGQLRVARRQTSSA